MIEKFLKQTEYTSHQDFTENYRIEVPENFNFAYDIIDEWAKTHPDKRAICWTNDRGKHHDVTFAELKELSDKTASFFNPSELGKETWSCSFSNETSNFGTPFWRCTK